MKSKARKSNFQECKIIPITDPAEIAALERRIQAAEKHLAGRGAADKPKKKPRKAVPGVMVDWKAAEVTDPAEFAELERRVRAAEKAMAAREKALAALENGSKPKVRKRK